LPGGPSREGMAQRLLTGTARSDAEQALAADAVSTASVVQYQLAMEIDDLTELAEGSPFDLLR
jgi:hypothetical protein